MDKLDSFSKLWEFTDPGFDLWWFFYDFSKNMDRIALFDLSCCLDFQIYIQSVVINKKYTDYDIVWFTHILIVTKV